MWVVHVTQGLCGRGGCGLIEVGVDVEPGWFLGFFSICFSGH